jgi:N-acetylglucosaminyldiphosphoundecaprenol N-acetyl-beta-D-mannosaminyltransferase
VGIMTVEKPMKPELSGNARRDLFGISLDPFTMEQAVARCVQAIENRRYVSIAVVNAAKVVWMRRDSALRRSVTDCDIILADGQSVVWASRILGAPLPERVAGIDLFMELLAEAERKGYRVYFLGARPDVLASMISAINQQFPALTVAGSHDGYFSRDEEPKVAEEIQNSHADLLFLGISSPKKELFLDQWGQSTGVHVAHGVGGSFDVLAGVTARAPMWWQRHGLEWLYRAWQEPLRLGPRYVKTNAAFIRLLGTELVMGAGRKRREVLK